MTELTESKINLISEETKVEGKIHFHHGCRIHGVVVGDLSASKGAEICVSEKGMIEGNIHADILFVDGYVKGDISADTKVVISSTGKVVGNIESPLLELDYGAYFDGKAVMEKLRPNPSP